MAKKRAKKRKDTRPAISRQDLEMQVAVAGSDAVRKASKQGTDPRLLKALARGASKESIGGIDIGAASLNSMVALDRYWNSDLAQKATGIMGLVHTAFAYLRPDDALVTLGASDAAFDEAAAAFAKQIPLEHLREITAAIRGHIRDLFPETGGAADAEAPAGEPPSASASRSKHGRRK